MLKGFDISHLDYQFPWHHLSPDFKFVYCKATQGATYKDPNFNEYWQYLKTTTLLRGAYIFWDCRYTAQQHWDNLASLGIDFSKPNVLPLCLDIENQMKPELDTWVIHNSAECIQSITDLLELIKINTGRKPMMYTYSNYLKEYLAGHSWQDCYLWLADYDGVAPKQHWDLWQTSQYGTTSGKLSGGNLDIDYFNGTIEELAKL